MLLRPVLWWTVWLTVVSLAVGSSSCVGERCATAAVNDVDAPPGECQSCSTSRKNVPVEKLQLLEPLLKRRKAAKAAMRFADHTPEHDMVLLPGGTFRMGTTYKQPPKHVAASAANYVAEGEYPSRRVRLSPFYMDKREVSNAQFAAFVKATAHKSDAEHYEWSYVFEAFLSEKQDEKLNQAVHGASWWVPVPHATWLHPEGPDRPSVFEKSDLTDVYGPNDRAQHPVVHVSWNDADSYCRWRGMRLPTEAEFEFAARGGLANRMWPWGDGTQLLGADGTHMMNVFQGSFPEINTEEDGFFSYAPVDAFPPNAYGLHNLLGNVWEWVSDTFTTTPERPPKGQSLVDPSGPNSQPTNEPKLRKTQKGGSFLCHHTYCYRYRTSARLGSEPDSSTLNTGFRCAKDGKE